MTIEEEIQDMALRHDIKLDFDYKSDYMYKVRNNIQAYDMNHSLLKMIYNIIPEDLKINKFSANISKLSDHAVEMYIKEFRYFKDQPRFYKNFNQDKYETEYYRFIIKGSRQYGPITFENFVYNLDFKLGDFSTGYTRPAIYKFWKICSDWFIQELNDALGYKYIYNFIDEYDIDMTYSFEDIIVKLYNNKDSLAYILYYFKKYINKNDRDYSEGISDRIHTFFMYLSDEHDHFKEEKMKLMSKINTFGSSGSVLEDLCNYDYSIEELHLVACLQNIPNYTFLSKEQICIRFKEILKRKLENTPDCNNEYSIIGDSVLDIPKIKLFTWDQGGKTYCEDIHVFNELLKSSKKNPYTNQEFSKETISSFYEQYAFMIKPRLERDETLFLELIGREDDPFYIKNSTEQDFKRFMRLVKTYTKNMISR